MNLKTKKLKSKAEKVKFLKDVQSGVRELSDLIENEIEFWHKDWDKEGYYTGTFSRNEKNSLILNEVEFQDRMKKRKKTKFIIFVPQEGCEPIIDEQIKNHTINR